MCGLFGVAGNLTLLDKAIFKNLGYPSMLRGMDGTGVLEVTKKSAKLEHRIIKNTHHYADFIDYLPAKDPLWDSKLAGEKVLMGHVRAATVGKLTDSNSHPFEHGPLVAAHNGTLVDLKYDPKKQDITDSELMIKDFAEEGIKETLDQISSDSAYAVSVYNSETETLSFARNSERPLAIAYNLNRNVIYWASELAMLEWVLNKAGITYSSFGLQELALIEVGVGPLPFNKEGKIWDVKTLTNSAALTFYYPNGRVIPQFKANNFGTWCTTCHSYMTNSEVEEGFCERRNCPGFQENEDERIYDSYSKGVYH